MLVFLQLVRMSVHLTQKTHGVRCTEILLKHLSSIFCNLYITSRQVSSGTLVQSPHCSKLIANR